MLRPSFPGGHPYPPRPGEPPAGVRYVFPPGAGAAAGGPPPASPYTGREAASVYGRQQPPDVRGRDSVAGRMPLRNPSYSLYHGDFRDSVQVLSVGGRPEGVAHVVPGPGPSLHPVLEAGHGAGPSHPARDPKRARMGDMAPLRIDTREVKEPGYHPQVEAISPTPDDNNRPERDDVRSTKEDLLQKISKVDREIAKAESQIAKLKKKQHELEDAANKPSTDSSSEESAPNQSLAQMVYSENRRKAEESHAALDKLSAKNDLPLYNQPSDTEQYSNNKKNYTVFKKKLVEYFKKAQAEREQNDRNMLITYCKLSVRWNKKIDRIENSRKRKEREAKCREMYEKMFPELRKQREDKERDARLGTRGVVKSDADFEDVIERLQEQENEDKKMHSYAVIPPLLLPSDLIKRKFTNTNGLIPDPMVIYNDRKYVNMWNDQEKETFREKFLQHPKNFGAIAQYLERKTVADCVQYYYLSKKTENYKQLLRRSKTRRPRAPRQPAAAAPPPEVIPTGMTTTRPWTRNMRNEADKGTKEDNAGKGSRSGTPNIKNEENGDGNEKETGKKKPDRARDSKKTPGADNQNDSSDEEDSNQAVKSGPHPCVICKQIVEQSRAVSKAQAAQLGLKEEDVGSEGCRVCNKCWCNTLKKKHICPVPSCTSSKRGNRAKLRHLPSKWGELDTKSRDTISQEMGLPEGTKRVCTACFTRITRRIQQLDVGGAEGGAEVKKEKEESVSWTDAEIESAKTSLKSHGTNWAKMAELIKSKTEEQCKKFFYSQRKRLQLDKLVTEYKKSRSGSDKPSLTSDEESGSTTSSCEDEHNTENTEKAADIKPPLAPDAVKAESEAVKMETVKKEEGYDSAATVSADETGDHVAGGKPRPGPAAAAGAGAQQPSVSSENISVKDMMEMVISNTLGSNQSQPLPTTSSQAPSLNKMLIDAPPVPTKRNGGNGGNGVDQPPLVTSRPELEVRPVPAAGSGPAPDNGVMDLTTSRPGRASPSVSGHGHIEQFSYPGISRPPPEPQPESKGQEPPPAHGGNAKAKTTHNIMMQQESNFPPMFRKDNKSPAPTWAPGLVPRGDPRKDIKDQGSKAASQGSHHSKARLPQNCVTISDRERPSGSGSIMAGTPHPRHTPQPPAPAPGPPRPYDHSKGSILTGHPMMQTKPISPRGPPQPGRSSQPPLVDPYKGSSIYNINHHPGRGPGGAAEPLPSGTPSSSRDILAESYKTAQTLPKMREGGAQLHRTEPPRRDDPRYPSSSSSPAYGGSPYGSRSPFGPKDTGMRGDPRADIPTGIPAGGRGDPREVYRVDTKDPRAEIAARAALMDPLGRPLYIPGGAGRDPAPSRAPVGPGPAPPRGSITQGVPKQAPRDVEIFPSLRHPEVIITKQPQPHAPPPTSRPADYNLAVLAEEAANQKRIAAVSSRAAADQQINSRNLLEARQQYDARPKAAEAGRPGPGPPTPSEDQKQVMSRLNQMSESEKIQYYNALTQGSLRNTPDGNMTASLLIEAIITHQINKNTSGTVPGPGSRHSPQALTDGKESPSKVPSRSPSVKSITDRDNLEAGGSGVAAIRTSPGTMGEHIENMINKEVSRSTPSTSSGYPGPGTSQDPGAEHWKRRGYPPPGPEHPGYSTQQRPPSNSHPGLSTDERQIHRVAGPGPGQDRPDKPPSRSGSAHEAISPPVPVSFYQGQPDPAMARYFAAARRKEQETAAAAAGSSKSGPGFPAHFNDDYLKHKITEMMKKDTGGVGGAGGAVAFTPADLAAKAMSMGPPHKRPLDLEARGSPSEQPQPESPRKKYKTDDANDAPDSPESGNMVIDETARPDSAHSHKTSSPAPTEAGHAHFPPGFRGQPPRSSPAPPRPPPANPRYEPLSDDD